MFGNFYTHELSFFLIDNNDLKNLKNIFKQCNLKVKRIISKNFIEGVNLINTNPNTDTFFKLKLIIITHKYYTLKIHHLNLFKILILVQILS